MPDWDAELEVTETLARRLFETQFPELSPVRLSDFGVGWDNRAYLVNDAWVFRFPQRAMGGRTMDYETAVTPRLTSLPLAISWSRFIGRPSSTYPWRFSGAPLVAGESACRAHVSDEQRASFAEPLGKFLAALHAVDASRARHWGAPGDWIQRMDLPARHPRWLEKLDELPSGLREEARDLERIVATEEKELTARGAWQGCPERVLCHGDLYSRHLIVRDGALAGVIDWGDVHVGDAAVDLAIGFEFLPRASRVHFRNAYGDVDDATWRRARVRAAHHVAWILQFAAQIEDADLVAECRRGLRHIADGD
ncbi:MAG: phosphotransferase [Pirellulaceae bacterium]|jgi:aminoglycoside phosphotransferase (APT) family kinase protein|nr:phosphotransferase [Pirellulaceae bacterium]MDP7014350.1 phosphotransferase [Pirellulaceae bacterium]